MTLLAGAGWGLVFAVGVPLRRAGGTVGPRSSAVACVRAAAAGDPRQPFGFVEGRPRFRPRTADDGRGDRRSGRSRVPPAWSPRCTSVARSTLRCARSESASTRRISSSCSTRSSIQRQVGGSLAELFELVSETVREREQFRRKLRSITGMVRTSATVLTFLPLVAAIGLTLVNHSYEAPLFTTTAGQILSLVTIAMMVLGGVDPAADRIGETLMLILLVIAAISFTACLVILAETATPTARRRHDAVESVRRFGGLSGVGSRARNRKAPGARRGRAVRLPFRNDEVPRAASAAARLGGSRRQGQRGSVHRPRAPVSRRSAVLGGLVPRGGLRRLRRAHLPAHARTRRFRDPRARLLARAPGEGAAPEDPRGAS